MVDISLRQLCARFSRPRFERLQSFFTVCVLFAFCGFFCFKATPHNDCCAIAPSDFSSDCLKSAGNTFCIAEHFGRYDGKDASKRATKASAAHCAVLP
jgi:hypothetical protein